MQNVSTSMTQTSALDARSTKVIRPPAFNAGTTLRHIREFSDYTDLFLTLSLHRIKVRYKQSVLGIAWAVLQPVSLMLIYIAIFSIVSQMPSDGLPYAVFVFAALLPWTYFSTAVSAATTSLVAHNQMVTKVYFPREILPLSYVVVGVFDFIIATTVLAGLMIYYHVAISFVIVWAIPILLVETMFVAALSILFSAILVRFRDLGFAMPLILQLWMFATPVVYPLSKVPARFRGWYVLNPMVGVVENFRHVVLQRQSPDLPSLQISFVISAVLLVFSYAYFKHKEATMADII
jgi:lipopolysaccharide transport system permease protein